MNTAVTPEDIANVCKLLERLRTGEMNLIPSVASIGERKQDAGTAMLQRVETVLASHLRRMQEPIGDGGAAFPSPAVYDPAREQVNPATAYGAEAGMPLRDYFAAKAMQGLVNGPAAQNICNRDPRYDETNFAGVVAINAYEFADAMLKARQS